MLYIAPPTPERNPTAQAPDVVDVELPLGFNPQRFPIIARHWYGLDLTHSAGRAAASLVADLRFRNKMAVLLAMGQRTATEFVAEFAIRHGLEAEMDELFDRYLEIDADALDATGGRDFPPIPLHETQK